MVLGSVMLLFLDGAALLVFSTMMYNYALGFSCLHALVVNVTLLPKPLRPSWGPRLGLIFGSFFFITLAVVTMWKERNNADLWAVIDQVRSWF